MSYLLIVKRACEAGSATGFAITDCVSRRSQSASTTSASTAFHKNIDEGLYGMPLNERSRFVYVKEPL